jgi:response regulator RpfG family c-di-GMP phosphodiesterase
VTVEDRKKCFESGMDDYLGKPFTSDLLRKKLYRWLHYLVSDRVKKIEPVVTTEKETESIETERVEKTERSEREKLFHDLKNMLLAIYGSAELSLITTVQSDNQKKHMERIHRAAGEANQIVETIAKNCTEKMF